MKYSFVLPAYKAAFLREAIDSILAQTYHEFELVVVNDASPEDLDSIVGSYLDPRIKYYKNKINIGGANLVKQWNQCVDLCDSKYLILASDDDIYDPKYLEKMDNIISKYPNANVYRPRFQLIDSYGRILGVEGCLKEYSNGLEFLYAWVNKWIGSGIPFYVFRRDSLMRIGGFAQYPLAWFSDDATVLRLAENGIITLNEVLFSFRWSGLSISSKKNKYSSLKEKIKATNLFLNEGLQYISNHETVTPYMEYIKDNLEHSFPYFIFENKMCGQLSSSSWIDAMRVIPFVLSLPFVNRLSMLKWYIRYTLRSLGANKKLK